MANLNTIKKQQEFWRKYQELNIRKPKVRNPIIGRMYSFLYKSKLYHSTRPPGKLLPYYDKFPLIIVIGLYNNGFLGLNLHYLPPKLRNLFLEKIMKNNYKKFKHTKEKTVWKEKKEALNLPYADIVSAFKIFYTEGLSIIKRYLTDHVKGNVAEIPPSEWLNVINQEAAKWINTTAESVYKDITGEVKQSKKKAYKIREKYKRLAQKDKKQARAFKQRYTRSVQIRRPIAPKRPKRKL